MFNVKALFAQIGLPASPCPYEENNLIQIQRNGYGPGAELRKGFMMKVLYETTQNQSRKHEGTKTRNKT